MKILRSHEPGGPDTLTLDEIDDPQAGAGELLVRVRAAAVNFPDVLIIEDKYQMRPPRPFAPGGEIAGTVEAVGDGVEGWSVGDRLVAVPGFGGMAEKIVINAKSAFRLPEDVSFTKGAALLLTYATAIHALVDRGRIEKGQSLLVLGAAGGVGLAAVELGKALGARVVAGVSNAEKARAARDAGADDCVIYDRAPFDKDASKKLAGEFKKAAGGDGFDIVMDNVGGDYSEPALRSIGWEGRFLVIGFPAGIARLPLNLTLLKSCDVCGVFWGAFAMRDPKANAAHVERLFDMVRDGSIAPRVTGTFPLERGGEAISRLGDRKAIGKLVITLD